MSDNLDKQIDEAFKRKAEENLDKTLELIIEKYLQKFLLSSAYPMNSNNIIWEPGFD